MPRRIRTPAADPDVQSLLHALAHYKKAHPQADIAVQRQNFASLRIYVVDPDFTGMDRVDRHDTIWKVLEHAPEDVQSQITFVLGLTPREAKTSCIRAEFENPAPSRL